MYRVLSCVVAFLAVGFFFNAPIREAVFGPLHNECLMTYMYPSYKQVSVPNTTSRYRLWLYKEAQDSRRLKLSAGLPVLYVPGNAGSYKQVRSFGAEAHRGFFGVDIYGRGVNVASLVGLGSEAGSEKNALDFWAVDFHEELSGLSGALLERQSDFVAKVIQHLAHLYRDSFSPLHIRPSSVVLLGHSMGGVAILNALSKYELPVHSVVSMATPHLPAVLPDRTMARVYTRIESAADRLDQLALVSIGGGPNDQIVASRLSVRGLYADSQSISRAHVSADHLCIVWCNQVVKAVVGGLFAMIDPLTKDFMSDQNQRLDAMRKRLFGQEIRQMQLTSSDFELVDDSTKLAACSVFDTSEMGSITAAFAVANKASAFVRLKHDNRKQLHQLKCGVLTSSAVNNGDPRYSGSESSRSGRMEGLFRLDSRDVEQVTLCSQGAAQLCSEKRVFGYGYHYLGDSCALRLNTTSRVVRLTFHFENTGKTFNGASVFAINHFDNQTRLIHSLVPQAIAYVRFDSSLAWNVSIFVVFPSDSQKRQVAITGDSFAVLGDFVRPYWVDLVFVPALLWSLVLLSGIGVDTPLVSALGVFLVVVALIAPQQIILSQLAVGAVFATLCRGLGYLNCLRLPEFFVAALTCVTAGIVSVLGLPPFLAMLWIPLAGGKTRHARARASLVLISIPPTLLQLFVWIRVLQEEGLNAARADFAWLDLAVAMSPAFLLLAPKVIPMRRQYLLMLLGVAFFIEAGNIYVVPYVCAAAISILGLTNRNANGKVKTL